MNMKTRRQVIRETVKRTNYHNLSKNEKGIVLRELSDVTGLPIHYLPEKIKKMQLDSESELYLIKHRTKNRKYGLDVIGAVKDFWKMLKFPCSQILEAYLRGEGLQDTLAWVPKNKYSLEVINKLKTICAKTIDIRLRNDKLERRKRIKYVAQQDAKLKQQVPVKLAWELNRDIPGFFQFDLVEHCGSNVFGPFIQTVAFVDGYSGWWYGLPLIRGTGEQVLKAIKQFKAQLPFKLLGLHPDNGAPVLNYLIKKYTDENEIEYTRSRPYHKDDNHLIEGKNNTNIRQVIGYSRLENKKELAIMIELFQAVADLKNYFTPSIKQTSKIRIGGHTQIQRKDIRTACQRLLDSEHTTTEEKEELLRRKKKLNPFLLSKKIDDCINLLFKTSQAKYLNSKVERETFKEQFSSCFLTT